MKHNIQRLTQICGCLFFILFLAACDQAPEPDFVQDPKFECSPFRTGIINDNDFLVGQQIDSLASVYQPQIITGDDPFGHMQNLASIIIDINAVCDTNLAVLQCYACIETFPLQSEIRISLNDNGNTIERIIDINTPSDAVMTFAGMHE